MLPSRRTSRLLPPFPVALLVLVLAGCAESPEPYVYRYVPGRTATVGESGAAVAPSQAPEDVRTAIAAGNRIAGRPYAYGGGHRDALDAADGYDCSGATSYVLAAAGALRGSQPLASDEFRRYGERGLGDWISVYARRGHVFLVVAGLRFDTGWTKQPGRGPHWTTRSRTAEGCVVRHPEGL